MSGLSAHKASQLKTPSAQWSAGRGRWVLLWFALLAAAFFALRLAAPPNLLDQDQENPASYVLDALLNGHWACQQDLNGGITSKPPFYTWCAATVALITGRVSLFSLYLPGALALFGSMVLVFQYGRSRFGFRAGVLAGLACLWCTAGLKQLGLARTDGVFAFTVTAAAFLAYEAWLRGRGWVWFWVVAAVATLTKGPLGLILSLSGLAASLWERRSGDALPLRGAPWRGGLLYLALTAGWLGLAYRQLGEALIDKLFVQELVFHVVEGEQKKLPGTLFYLSPLYYLGRGAPWSLAAYFGLWRIWKHPASALPERRFERFLFCWFVLGLFLFSMSPHQRGDLLWPLMPAGALIAGRELAKLSSRWSHRAFSRAVLILGVLAASGFGIYYFGPRAREAPIRQTLALERLASELTAAAARSAGQRAPRPTAFQSWRFGPKLPLTHTDDAPGLQVFQNSFCPPVSMERAVEVLRGHDAAYVAVHDLARLQAARRPEDPPWYTILDDHGPVERLRTRIVGNRPSLITSEPRTFWLGSVLVGCTGVLTQIGEERLTFDLRERTGRVTLSNRSSADKQVRLGLQGLAGSKTVVVHLTPGQTASLPLRQ